MDRKIVVFLDSFGETDLARTPWIADHCFDGTMDAGVPFVTPTVMGSIYTGTTPGQHGLPAVSRYDTDARLRPIGTTIPELAAESDDYGNVLQFGLPFITPSEVDPDLLGDDTYWAVSDAMGQRAVQPPDAQAQLTVAGPAGSIDQPEEDQDVAFDLRVDYTEALFATARNVMQGNEFEVAFISYRLLDSYCHYQFTEPSDGSLTYRDRLLSLVDEQVSFLSNYGDVFVFGDHGARELVDVFRVNRWLLEHGFLDVDVDEDWRAAAREYGVMSEYDGPGDVILPSDPGVRVDEGSSVAVCDDPFSSGLTLLDGATPERITEMCDAFLEEDAVADVRWVWCDEEHVELEYGWPNRFLEPHWQGDAMRECPNVYLERAPGWFVSSNLAAEKGGPELTRTGVHDPIGAWGATTDLDVDDDATTSVSPTELHHIIVERFLGIDASDVAESQKGARSMQSDESDVREHLADLGYL